MDLTKGGLVDRSSFLRRRPGLLVLIITFGLLFGGLGSVLAEELPRDLIRTTLPNGLLVTILPEPSFPVVSVQVWYHVGSANETARTRGFAHLFEHLMFGGTAAHDKRDQAEYVRSFGGEENAFTSLDETVFHATIVPEGLAGILAFEADRMIHLKLDQANLDNEKRIVTEELRLSEENEPMSRILVKAQKAVLGEHPYAHWPTGTKEDIAAANLEQVRDFYSRYYRPKNAHLVIVGPVEGPAVMEEVQRQFGPLPAEGETPADPPPVLGWPTPQLVRLKDDIPPVEIAALIFPLPEASHPDSPAFVVLSELLSSGTIDLFQEKLVRQRKKAVFAETWVMNGRRGGAISFLAAALPYRRQTTAFRLMNETIAALGAFDWLTPERLAAAKGRLLRYEEMGRLYADNRALAIGRARWWRGDEARAFDFAQRIERVGREDLERVFATYILKTNPVKVYVRPNHVPLWIRLFGWLQPLVG